MADVDVAALQADRRHLEQRTSDLSAEVERLRKQQKRIENAEEKAAKAEARAVALETRCNALEAELAALRGAHESLQEHALHLEGDSAALHAIKNALGL